MEAAEPYPALVVRRWTRYGKDRLYVTTESGEKVGWLDLATGRATVERPELATAFERAVSIHRAGHDGPAAVLDRPTEASDVAGDRRIEAVWTDLATNRPGQAVRAEADALLAGMKSRSRVGAFLNRLVDAKTDERAFRVGAAGEEAAGPRLERLRTRGWHVLHSIPVGERGSDIDHLLIGPGGVYTVNTKNHPGGRVWVGEHAVRVNGQPTQYLRNSRFEAERVRRVLVRHVGEEIPVHAVLILLTGTVVPKVTIKRMPPDVLVLDRADVPGVFKRAPERLSPEQIERIYDVARRSTTWSASRTSS